MEAINIRKYIAGKAVKHDEDEDKELLQAISESVNELEVARSLFDNVQDSGLIDVAIYSEAVAKKRYEYLLSLAKQKGLKVSKEYILDQCLKIVE